MEISINHRLRKSWKWLRAMLVIGIIFFILFLAGAIGIYIYGVAAGPPPLAVPQTSIFYGDDGTVIGESNNGENRYWVSLEEISEPLIQATLAIEDRKFFDHFGFDFIRIAGAALADIKAMAKVQGASTITQQYARNLYLEHDKSWKRKIEEALLTIRLEINYSKEEILEGYLNTIYYGHGAYGIEAAANYYFGKNAKDLSLAEAAMLAGIPKAPSYYSPFKDEERAANRQRLILKTMKENNQIQEKDIVAATSTPLTYITSDETERTDVAPYFIDEVKKELINELNIDKRQVAAGGLKIYTTLDSVLQQKAESQVKTIMSDDSEIQTALVAIDPKTNEVKALIGGRDYKESPYNRATQAERMPGSTFKPFLYYMAIENGFTPSTTMKSEPVTFRFDEGRAVYRPQNFNNYYANDFITLAQAIALSDNIYAVKTNMFLGPDNLAKAAQKFGITSNLDKVPSLALGTSAVRVIDMVSSYSVLADGGKKADPIFVKRVESHNGEVLYENKGKKEQVLDQKASFVTTHLMTGMFDPALNDYTSVTGSSIKDVLSRPYAGKSGTTKTDSWMIGFTPNLVTGVWVGYDRDQQITLLKERQYAKQIWAGFMESAHEGLPITNFRPPEGVVARYINPNNGKLATDSCPVKRLSYFIEGTEPTSYCTDHEKAQPIEEEVQQQTEEPEEKKGWFKRFIDFIS